MRWKPPERPCVECGYSWSVTPAEAIALVAALPDGCAAALSSGDPTRAPAPGVWSPGEYVWHLVDVMRIGTERLWTLTDDARAGVPCWDENALASVRQYSKLSVPVGLRGLRSAVREWLDAAAEVPAGAAVEHPLYGLLTATDVIRRHAHEAQHHLLDITRGLEEP
ncbi:MAG: DinB family protein [Jiangellaceae bacterium]